MKIRNYIYILLACYSASFLRIFVNNILMVSIIGSFLFGFVIAKRLNNSKKKILLSGFFSCFTSFSGIIYFFYKVFNEESFIKSIIFFNLFIILNLFTMYFGFWVSRKFN